MNGARLGAVRPGADGCGLGRVAAGRALATVPGAPHNVYYQAAAAYNELATAFLAELRPGWPVPSPACVLTTGGSRSFHQP
jgi:hypothetical protein